VMTEHVVALRMLVSGDGLAFGTVAAPILTHGNAWALSLVPGITFALSNRWYLLRLGFWLAPVPVVVTCVPWNVFLAR
jgi:hypothetical protein